MPQEPARKPVVEPKAPAPRVGMGRALLDLIKPEKQPIPDPFDVKANAAVPVGLGDIVPEYVERKTGSAVAGMAAGILTPSSKIGVGKNLRKMIGDYDDPAKVARALERASWTPEQLDKWGGMGNDPLYFMERQLESSERALRKYPNEGSAKNAIERWKKEIEEFKKVNRIKEEVEPPVVQTGRHTQTDGVSDEVVNWLQSRKEQNITRWVVKKDGSAIELTGVNSRDYRVPADAVLVDVQNGKPQILDIGSGVPKAHVEGVLARGAKNFKK